MYQHKRLFLLSGALSITVLVVMAFLALVGGGWMMGAQAAPTYTSITTDTTWDTDQTFDTDVVVENGATLTIASGVVTTFSNVANAQYPGGLSDKNELIVESGGRLVIQSGARLTAVAISDWYGVVFLAGSDGEVDGATLERGVAGVTIIDASPDVRDNLIQNMRGGGSSVGILGAGIIVSGTSASRIEGNHITQIRGADGLSRSDGSGDNGWAGGSAVGIYVHGATPDIIANFIGWVTAGGGGDGGGGQPGDAGGPGANGGDGGDGGDGGPTGLAWGIRVEGPTASTSWGIYNNTLQSINAAYGGDGGNSGAGGAGGAGASGTTGEDGGAGGDAGNPGDGADGRPAYGIYIKNASPAVHDNLVSGVFGGGGGWPGRSYYGGGDPGDGGDGGDGSNGDGGNGGKGGDSCTDPAKAGDGATAYGILIDGASSSDVRHNTVHDVEGGWGALSTRCEVGDGGDGGSGGGSGSHGTGGDSGMIWYTSLGHSGHGGNAFGIQVIFAAPTIARNYVYDVEGGDSGHTSTGAHTRGGSPAGQASNAGPGADGGNGGNAYGICTDTAMRIENNIVHDVNGGDTEDGSKGGTVFYSSVPANGGDGGEGGNGGSGWGIYANGADPEIVNNTVVNMSLANAGSGGAGGSGYLGSDGVPGGGGIPGRADGIFMDNGARPPTVNNIVAQMTGATGYGISSRTAQSGFELDYNLVWNWPLGNYNPSLISGTHSVVANPLFVDWVNDDFYLQPTSPAIDQGTNGSVSIPTDDRDGVSRPQDGDENGTATTDIGAYEVLTGTASFDVTTAAGSWASADGYLTVDWAAGAVTSTLPLTYTPRGLLHPDYPFSFGGIGFTLDVGESVTFTPPLTLTIHYDEASLPQGMDEETMGVYRWNSTLGQWESLTIIGRDTTANIIIASLDHLSDFALLGTVKADEHKIYLPVVLRNCTP